MAELGLAIIATIDLCFKLVFSGYIVHCKADILC